MENKKFEEALKSFYLSLTDEQKEKAKSCTTSEELIKLACEEGIELPDEVLEEVSGGLNSFQVGQVIGKYCR